MDAECQERLLKEALAELERDGFSISADRFARLKPFGIVTTGSRGSLPRMISPECFQRLRFLLEVERRFDFRRDRDGLAFELAFVGYPVIPWDRVQTDVYKRPKTVLTRLNVLIHKIAGEAGTHLDEREIVRAAKNLASRYAPRQEVRASGLKRVVHQLLSGLFEVLLRVMYLDANISVAVVRRLLLTAEFSIETVDLVAPALTESLNDPNVLGLLKFADKHAIVAAMHTSETDPAIWKQTFEIARSMGVVVQNLARVFSPGYDLALEMRFPSVETIPSVSTGDLEFTHAFRVAIVGLAFMLRTDPRVTETIETMRTQSPVSSKFHADLARLKEQIPLMLLQKHGD